ncbi:MAG: hypothetical protein QOE70_3826 [Chthoniobacter sp.]|nr:hypothetical protein [Chthoniobacter sp.]
MDNPPPLPPLYRDQRVVDQEHLKLLAIFHYVVAGLAFAMIGFLVLHFMMMRMFFDNPEMWKDMPNPPPHQFFAMFKWLYLIMGSFMIFYAIGNLLSGLWIRAKKNRMFSLVMAGLNCIQIPFGTVLGVFTIVVLVRDSVRELYEGSGVPS